MNGNALIAMPFVLALILIIGLSVIPQSKQNKSTLMMSEINEQPKDKQVKSVAFSASESDSSSCGTCPGTIKAAQCTDSKSPVLGGLDVVNYFTAYKLSTGVYNDTQPGVAGLAKFSSVYNGYTFRFTTELNKKLFESNPTKYMPQYGGFCTWGITTEFCPQFPWSTECMGPYGNWHHWTIHNEKLYLFWFDSAKTNFLSGVAKDYIAAGDKRWKEWHGDDYQSVFSTNCYVSNAQNNEPSGH